MIGVNTGVKAKTKSRKPVVNPFLSFSRLYSVFFVAKCLVVAFFAAEFERVVQKP
jgi:hypothetical protein